MLSKLPPILKNPYHNLKTMKTTLNVNLDFFPLAWVLFVCTPVVEIDGEQHSKKWGNHSFKISPGKHSVKIYFPYKGLIGTIQEMLGANKVPPKVLMPECGANTVEIDVGEGQTSNIKYYFPPGSISVS